MSVFKAKMHQSDSLLAGGANGAPADPLAVFKRPTSKGREGKRRERDSVADVPGRQHLRSAGRHLMDVPRHRRTTFGRRAFCCWSYGLELWNTLREQSDEDSFKRQLKTFLFSRTLGLAYAAH